MINEADAQASAPTAASTAVRIDAARVFSKDEALQSLRSQPGGRITATDAELGREWSRHWSKVGKWMRAWGNAGLVKRKGNAVIALGLVGGTDPEVQYPVQTVVETLALRGVQSRVQTSICTRVHRRVQIKLLCPSQAANWHGPPSRVTAWPIVL
jgi:hypothetical protein